MTTPLERLQAFAGVGVGAGFGMGCGVGAASGTGGQGTLALSAPLPLRTRPSMSAPAPRVSAHAPAPPPGRPRVSCAHARRPRPLRVPAPVAAAAGADWTRARVLTNEYAALRPSLPRPPPPQPPPVHLAPCAPALVTAPAHESATARARRLLRAAVAADVARKSGATSKADVDAVRKASAHVPAVPTAAVRFVWSQLVARSAFVAGSFNDWGPPVQLSRSGDTWARVIRLPIGTYHYRFVVDGRWVVDEERRIVTITPHGRVNELNIPAWAARSPNRRIN